MICEINKTHKCNIVDCPVALADFDLWHECCDFKHEEANLDFMKEIGDKIFKAFFPKEAL